MIFPLNCGADASLADVQVWISGNDGPRVIHHGFYPLCLNRKSEPGLGHTDQMNFAFRLTLGMCEELSRVYPAVCRGVHVSSR
jgi:hypothetical protein